MLLNNIVSGRAITDALVYSNGH